MAFMFEKLDVYQKAVDFADEFAALAEHFPRGFGFLVVSVKQKVAWGNCASAKGNEMPTITRTPGEHHDR